MTKTPMLEGSALLSLLQRQLIKLGQTTETTASEKQQLSTLIALIYHAQQDSMVLTTEKTELSLDMTISALTTCFPTVIGGVDKITTPIVTFAGFIAFRRDYQGIQKIADYLRCHHHCDDLRVPTAKALSCFDWSLADGADLNTQQRLAVFSAASLPFAIITGGAGTGKTTTLTKALELILLDNPDANIVLAAPTGKAAHRLNESLNKQLPSVNPESRNALAVLKAQTLHRVLGISERTGKPYYHAGNPLYCDVMAIDEASMVGGDLFLLLQSALLAHTKLMLLGDANQLPAVESWAFFNAMSQLPIGYSAAFCEAVKVIGVTLTEQSVPLPNHICQLTESKRFSDKTIVAQCADAVLAGDANMLTTCLSSHYIELSMLPDFYHVLAEQYPKEPQALLAALSERIILCANRQGAYGSEAISHYLDDYFRDILGQRGQQWYVGRRIMIVQNDYQLDIHNGDIGVCQLVDGDYVIVFDECRVINTEMLSIDYVLAFAISIHKSQGSEYQHVDIVLDVFDAQFPNRLVTPALLYTAITRAKQYISLYADAALLHYALQDNQMPPSPLLTLLSTDNK